MIRHGTNSVRLAAVREVPLTFGGAARFQLQNLLAASAVAYVQGMPAERIREGLLGFVPSVTRTPGRLNVIETARGRVILDYAHNAAAIAGLLDFVVGMPAERRMAIIGVPGDRRDEDLREVGRLAARMDYVIFKEYERYRRGRPAGEGARLLAEGLLATGFPPERVATFNEESDAVAHVIDVMRPGDVVVIIADGPSVLQQFSPGVLGA
jgi:cyanophycin synthetase